MVTVAITGHRPEDLPNIVWVKDALSEAYRTVGASFIVQGMAAGVDLLSAVVASELNIPYECARPWAGHTARAEDVNLYQQVLNEASVVTNVNPATEYLGPWLYHNRNHYMVDKADVVIAVWSGKKKGGTYAAVQYALKKNLPIFQLNPAEGTVGWFHVPAPVEREPETLF